MEVLGDNLELLNRPRITEEEVLDRAEQLNGLKVHAVPGRCDGCFDEVNSLFQQQTVLMRSLRLYRSREEVRETIDVLPEIEVVRDLLEPMSNVQRMIILKSLAKSPRSFSELSSLTNLRGGNLLFHIQRLTTSGMICQRSGRGDYALADRGMRALEMVNDLYLRTSASSGAGDGGGT
jgi:DNA-binding transcriptional ArsR family regulator